MTGPENLTPETLAKWAEALLATHEEIDRDFTPLNEWNVSREDVASAIRLCAAAWEARENVIVTLQDTIRELCLTKEADRRRLEEPTQLLRDAPASAPGASNAFDW